MKLIIDIDENIYNQIREGFYEYNVDKMGIAIVDGTPLDKIITGLEAHKWNKDEGSKAIYNSAINDAIAYIEEYKIESEDKK